MGYYYYYYYVLLPLKREDQRDVRKTAPRTEYIGGRASKGLG